MIIEKTLIKFGMTKDENNYRLKEVFKNDLKLKEIHIDIYPEHPLLHSSAPFMLLLRTIEKNVVVSNDNERIILKRNDGYSTYFLNLLFSEITECYYKYFDDFHEFILNVHNIYYRITISN